MRVANGAFGIISVMLRKTRKDAPRWLVFRNSLLLVHFTLLKRSMSITDFTHRNFLGFTSDDIHIYSLPAQFFSMALVLTLLPHSFVRDKTIDPLQVSQPNLPTYIAVSNCPYLEGLQFQLTLDCLSLF